jgi:hypothetical protein
VRQRSAGPPRIGFRNSHYTVSESDGYVRVPIAISGNLRRPIVVSVAIQPGSARAQQDFVAAGPQQVILDGQADSNDVLVPLVSDAIREHVEDFTIVLETSDPVATLGTRQANVTIIDDD